MMAGGRRIAAWIGGIVKVPKPDQPWLPTGKRSRHFLADFFFRARRFPNAHFVQLALKGWVGILLCNGLAQAIEFTGLQRGKTTGVGILTGEPAIYIDAHPRLARNSRHMDPFVQLQHAGHGDLLEAMVCIHDDEPKSVGILGANA